METISYSRAVSPSNILDADHDRVEALCANLIEAYEQDDWGVVRAAFNRLEAALAAHIEAEEGWLLPGYRLVEPEEARALENDHIAFRRQLAEIGVGIELHSVSADMVRELVARLGEHAAREDRTLYRWADGGLERGLAASLRARLEARVASALEAAAPR
jgi:hypothetical protein